MLDAEPKEMCRSMGGLSGLQSPPPSVRLATLKSTSGYVCTLSPACTRAAALICAAPEAFCSGGTALLVLCAQDEEPHGYTQALPRGFHATLSCEDLMKAWKQHIAILLIADGRRL